MKTAIIVNHSQIHPVRSPSLSLCGGRPTERQRNGGGGKTRFWATTLPSAVLSMLSRPARGPGSCFGLLLIKPIMSWKLSLQCVCVSLCVTEECVCPQYRSKIQSHQPQPQTNNTTLGDGPYWSVYHPERSQATIRTCCSRRKSRNHNCNWRNKTLIPDRQRDWERMAALNWHCNEMQ